jgi:hypothetical protein
MSDVKAETCAAEGCDNQRALGQLFCDDCLGDSDTKTFR